MVIFSSKGIVSAASTAADPKNKAGTSQREFTRKFW